MTAILNLSCRRLHGQALLCALTFLAGCTCSPQPASQSPSLQAELDSAPQQQAEPLQIKENLAGEGPGAAVGDLVRVHYEGRFPDGQVFDRSYDRGEPFGFILGRGQVIEGWERGLLGMRAGAKRQLIIDPSLGYGERGAGSAIPPGATLVFDVEMLEIHPHGGQQPEPNIPDVSTENN